MCGHRGVTYVWPGARFVRKHRHGPPGGCTAEEGAERLILQAGRREAGGTVCYAEKLGAH